MAVSGYLWLRMMVVASSTVWRAVAPARTSGELSPFLFSLSLSLSLPLFYKEKKMTFRDEVGSNFWGHYI
ncbi:unnamed protein product [Brassica oleracea var. botrytis]